MCLRVWQAGDVDISDVCTRGEHFPNDNCTTILLLYTQYELLWVKAAQSIVFFIFQFSAVTFCVVHATETNPEPCDVTRGFSVLLEHEYNIILFES